MLDLIWFGIRVRRRLKAVLSDQPMFFFKAMGKNPKYTYGVVKSSYVDSFFELNEDPAMRDMFRVMQGRGYLVRNFTVGVGRVQQG